MQPCHAFITTKQQQQQQQQQQYYPQQQPIYSNNCLSFHSSSVSRITSSSSSTTTAVVVIVDRSRGYKDCSLKGTSSSSSTREEEMKDTTTSHTISLLDVDELDSKQYGDAFLRHVKELLEFQKVNGHMLVPKRYKDNPTLGNWVNKTRQQYKHYCQQQSTQQHTSSTSMNDRRIDVLNQIGFVWSAKKTKNTSSLQSSSSSMNDTVPEAVGVISQSWWDQYQTLVQFMEVQSTTTMPKQFPLTNTPLGQWLASQRKQYNQSSLQQQQQQKWILLSKLLGTDWYKSSRQHTWELRIQQLKQFKQTYGHCMVPISYNENKSLANWVSTQRKHYNLYMAQKPSYMTKERIQELNELGFVWNRWDYEFHNKHQSS